MLGGLFVSGQPILDPDLGWHIATGRWIVTQWQIPYQDIFSFSLPNHPYIAHSWLQDIVLYLLETNFGLWGIQAWYMVLIVSTLSVFWLNTSTSKESFFLEKWLVVFFWLFGLLFIDLRSHLVSVLGLTLIHVWFMSWLQTPDLIRKNLPIWIGGMTLYFWIWAQMHAGIVIGIVFYGLWWLIFCSLKIFTKQNLTWKTLGLLGLLAILLFVLTLVNPYTWRIYEFVFNIATSETTFIYNQDWLPLLSNRFPSNTWLLRLTLLLLAVYGLASSTKWSERLFIGIFILLTLTSVRFVLPLLVVLTLPVCQGLSNIIVDLVGSSPPYQRFTQKPIWGSLIGLVLITGFQLVNLGKTWCVNTSEQCYAQLGGFPQRHVDYLSYLSSSKNVFNYYTWGGYLNWKLPQHRIFIDGRMDNFQSESEALIYQFAKIEATQSDWLQLFEKYPVELVLMPVSSSLTKTLETDLGWNLLLETEEAHLLAPPE